LPVVLWVEHREPFRNNAVGEVVQNPLLEATGSHTACPSPIQSLAGQGIVMGLSDSGIDMTHCMFADSNQSIPYNSLNMNHKKVVYYNTLVDSLDTDSGHGSLVASIAAGQSNASSYCGSAPASKISFVDIGDSSGDLHPPADLYNALLQPLYSTGASVSSHSWGSSTSSYTVDARAVDTFMWDHPDSLVLMAAGNSGDNGEETVGSPSTNKNGISVGATLSTLESTLAAWEYFGQDFPHDERNFTGEEVAYFSSQGPTSDGRLKPDLLATGV